MKHCLIFLLIFHQEIDYAGVQINACQIIFLLYCDIILSVPLKRIAKIIFICIWKHFQSKFDPIGVPSSPAKRISFDNVDEMDRNSIFFVSLR